MKYTVLGGGGFIGSSVTDRLLADGHDVVVFEHAQSSPYREFGESEKITWVKGDFTNADDIDQAVSGVDGVFHFISTTMPKSSNDDPIYDVQSNVVGTLQLLNAMVAHKVSKIVFLSSGGTVYGNHEYMPIDEQHPTNPTISYGITKLAIEKYLLMYQVHYGIDASILRVTNPYGRRQRVGAVQGAVGVFLGRAMTDTALEIWGDGSVVRDFIYIEDLVDACIKAVAYEGEASVFNISYGAGTSLNELIAAIENVLGRSIKVNYKESRTIDTPVNVLANDRAKRELNWAPKTSLQDGLSLTVDWINSHKV